MKSCKRPGWPLAGERWLGRAGLGEQTEATLEREWVGRLGGTRKPREEKGRQAVLHYDAARQRACGCAVCGRMGRGVEGRIAA